MMVVGKVGASVVQLTPVQVDGGVATAITVQLPKTTLIAVATARGYIMCGALDVDLLNTRLAERGIVAGRALGVRTVEDLLEAPLADVTDAARSLGICPGMKGRDAVNLML
jgi:uncharacterized protein YunC (DUF1805 family)